MPAIVAKMRFEDEVGHITALSFRYKQVLSEDAVALIHALLCHPALSITSVDLGYTRTDDRLIQVIAAALIYEHCKLECVKLDGNAIGNEGAQVLAKILIDRNLQLKSLNLKHNQIGDEGAIALANALIDENCELTSIDLGHNQIGAKGAQALVGSLNNPNCKIVSMCLMCSGLDDLGARMLADAVRLTNNQLKFIYLGVNQIKAKGASSLFAAVACNPFIQVMSGVPGCDKPLARNKALPELIETVIYEKEETCRDVARRQLKTYHASDYTAGIAKDYIDVFLSFRKKTFTNALLKVLNIGVMDQYIAKACMVVSHSMMQDGPIGKMLLPKDRIIYLAYLTCIEPKWDASMIVMTLTAMGIGDFTASDADLDSFTKRIRGNARAIERLQKVLCDVAMLQLEMGIAPRLILNVFKDCKAEYIKIILMDLQLKTLSTKALVARS